MFAFKLIQLIETRAEPLSEGLMRKLRKDDRCVELLRLVPSDELRRRSHEIYRNLNDWLRNKTESEIEERYIGLGMRRAKQGVPYSDFLWAVSTTKVHLWEFMQAEGLFAEQVDMFGGMDLLHSLDRFFDCILCWSTGACRCSWHHSATAVRLLRSRLRIVRTCTVNCPLRLRAQMCLKPRKSKVPGFFFPCLFPRSSA
jgi:hypothetical protein